MEKDQKEANTSVKVVISQVEPWKVTDKYN